MNDSQTEKRTSQKNRGVCTSNRGQSNSTLLLIHGGGSTFPFIQPCLHRLLETGENQPVAFKAELASDPLEITCIITVVLEKGEFFGLVVFFSLYSLSTQTLI